MKITSVIANNRKQVFEVKTRRGQWPFPYSKADPVPTASDPLVELYIDPELGREGFTYLLASGAEGSVHVEQALDYNEEPGYMRDLLLYKLTWRPSSASRRARSRGARSSAAWVRRRRSSTG